MKKRYKWNIRYRSFHVTMKKYLNLTGSIEFDVETESEAVTSLLEHIKSYPKNKKILSVWSLGKLRVLKNVTPKFTYSDTNWFIEDHVDLETYLENRLIEIE